MSRYRYRKMPVWMQPTEWPIYRLNRWLFGKGVMKVSLVQDFNIKRVYTEVFEHRKVCGEVYYKSRFKRLHGDGIRIWFTENFYGPDLRPLEDSVHRARIWIEERERPARASARPAGKPEKDKLPAAPNDVRRLSGRLVDHKPFGPVTGVLYACEGTDGNGFDVHIRFSDGGALSPEKRRLVCSAVSWAADAILFELDCIAAQEAARSRAESNAPKWHGRGGKPS
jgi:hypothetical protein